MRGIIVNLLKIYKIHFKYIRVSFENTLIGSFSFLSSIKRIVKIVQKIHIQKYSKYNTFKNHIKIGSFFSS